MEAIREELRERTMTADRSVIRVAFHDKKVVGKSLWFK